MPISCSLARPNRRSRIQARPLFEAPDIGKHHYGVIFPVADRFEFVIGEEPLTGTEAVSYALSHGEAALRRIPSPGDFDWLKCTRASKSLPRCSLRPKGFGEANEYFPTSVLLGINHDFEIIRRANARSGGKSGIFIPSSALLIEIEVPEVLPVLLIVENGDHCSIGLSVMAG